MTRKGLPKRQRLIGAWLLLSGISLLGGALFAAWLESQLIITGVYRAVLWLGCFSGGITLFLMGLLFERMLFKPLRQLQAQLARLVANPDADDAAAPEGWLKALGPDLHRVEQSWRKDRQQLHRAHAEGARSATRIRKELEALLQMLETPLLLYDRHRRLMLFNQAAEAFFDHAPGLGLGKRLEALFPLASMQQTLGQLPSSGTPRELLIPCDNRWLKVIIRHVPESHDEVLLTCSDATAAWSSERGVRAELAQALTPLRQHTASLVSAAEALGQVRQQGSHVGSLHQRLEQVVSEESLALSDTVTCIGKLLESLQRQGERLTPIWSNDFWQMLDDYLDPAHRLITPIGLPLWFKGDAPALMALLSSLVHHLSHYMAGRLFEGEVSLSTRHVYLDVIWKGKPIAERELAGWRQQRLTTLPLSPSVGDVLRQHASDVWSIQDADGEHARLRLPLPSVEQSGAPRTAPPRPEFHDFGIAELPSPDTALASCPLRSLELVIFDTETTGLELRKGDSVISIGACRIVNTRLLASDTFDEYVNPQKRIPQASTAIHGITDEDVSDAPLLLPVLERFRDYIGDAAILAHNAAFDMLAISHQGVTFDMPVLDTLLISRALDEALDGHDLDSLVKRYCLNLPAGMRHTALGDARVTAELWLALLPRLEARGISTVEQLLHFQASAFDREDANAL
ncbi:DNA polymerase-3 subunit epsilon [Vreelandella songnenensis]|uniref:DNA-directed DNA polymerase n=1 Tax=Vreelandella songnenensis TaxID=1176243 RepID=A0A2T0V696_9GAMM|nr:exonuclease domain-containing protein [Halomonas songnenensis]PRY65712.1 DNA polymerase-3 subunit epsilon [Halomonas songnenensis]